MVFLQSYSKLPWEELRLQAGKWETNATASPHRRLCQKEKSPT